MNNKVICWCGNSELQDFSPDYKKCGKCGTLVCCQTFEPDLLEVSGDESGFYGRDYWFDYQLERLNHPTLPERSRSDLSERVVYWLRTVLNYQLPPAKCLELGCGHGGFVALLRQVGFDAMGLELSPWVVEYAKDVFKIPMLLGPIEQQEIEDSSLDLIILMDVLEHLPDPRTTIRKCVRLLKPDGKLILQTPEFEIEKNYLDLKDDNDPFLKMLIPGEHIFLYSRDSIKKLLFDQGLSHVEFRESFFPYDMFFIAGRTSILENSIDEMEHFLLSSPNGRMTLALLDLDSKYSKSQNQLVESENDRFDRLQINQELEKLLEESEKDRAARLINMNELEVLLKESEINRDARLDAIHNLEESVNGYRKELAGKYENIESLQKELKIKESQLISKEAEIVDQKNRYHQYSYQIAMLEQELSGFPQNLIIRTKKKINSGLDRFTSRVRIGKHRKIKKLKKIVVDLTPIVPGGDNGGAKLLATTLVWQFSRKVAPECEYVLLTSDDAHDELSWLDAANVQRKCVNQRKKPDVVGDQTTIISEDVSQSSVSETVSYHDEEKSVKDETQQGGNRKTLIHRIGEILEKYLPKRIYFKIYHYYRFKIRDQRTGNQISFLKPDLIFCPFTAPFYHSPGIPIVIVVHDLQYLIYPQFFSIEDISHTDFHFRQSCKVADRLICVSEHTRQRVVEAENISPDRVKTIHTSLYNSLRKVSEVEYSEVLKTYKLEENRFLFFPANFWPHKNHEMLLTAFAMFRSAYPESDLKLVFTGAPGDRMEFLREAASKMMLKDWVIFAGFVDEKTLSAFFQVCRAVIFPSLYEGFGVPVLEAMSFGVPVLCSNLTSLPEIGQDAVHYFDPRRPDEIVAAIERIDKDEKFRVELIKKGMERAGDFLDPTSWATAYFDEFRSVVAEDRVFINQISGIFLDHWVSSNLEITVVPGEQKRFLEIDIDVPSWLAKEYLIGEVLLNGKNSKNFQSKRGQRNLIRIPVDGKSSKVEVFFSPSVQPKEIGIGDDIRFLSCQILSCNLLSPDSVINLYQAEIQ